MSYVGAKVVMDVSWEHSFLHGCYRCVLGKRERGQLTQNIGKMSDEPMDNSTLRNSMGPAQIECNAMDVDNGEGTLLKENDSRENTESVNIVSIEVDSNDSQEHDDGKMNKTHDESGNGKEGSPIQLEKNLVHCEKSTNWPYCLFIQAKETKKAIESGYDPSFEGIKKLHLDDMLKTPSPCHQVICYVCFTNPVTSLRSSIVGTNKIGTKSNFDRHMRDEHSVLYKATPKFGKWKTDDAKKSIQPTIMSYCLKEETNGEIAINLKMLINRFLNDANVSQRAVESDSFTDLIAYAINCKPTTTMDVNSLMMRYAMRNAQKTSFEKTFTTITRGLRSAANKYKELCGYQIPFLSICHDTWCGKKKEILGVTLVYIDPNGGSLFKIPVGLVASEGKDAETTSKQTMTVLSLYGIEKSWMFKGVNDNTSSAVKTTKLLLSSDDEGYCVMHKAELCVKHALGVLKWKRRGDIVDSTVATLQRSCITSESNTGTCTTRKQ